MKFKIGDRVIFKNPINPDSRNQNKKGVVTHVWPKLQHELEWYGINYTCSISVKFDKDKQAMGSFVDCVFQHDNSSVIKNKLGVK